MAISLTNEGVQFPDDSIQKAGLPVGVIALWSGSIETIPSKWSLCDGTNGTPNLSDKFLIGAGNTYTAGTVGGYADSIAALHTHSSPITTEIDGNHSHTFATTHTHTLPASTDSSVRGSHNHPNSDFYELPPAGPHNHVMTNTSNLEGDHYHLGYTPYGGGHQHNDFSSPSSENQIFVELYYHGTRIPAPSYQADPTVSLGPVKAHIHSLGEQYYAFNPGVPSDTPGPGLAESIYGTIPATTTGADYAGQHNHNIYISPEWETHIHPEFNINPAGDHRHLVDYEMADDGEHQHGGGIPLVANNNGTHYHDIVVDATGSSNMNNEPAGDHLHTISSMSVVETTSSATNSNIPPYYALAYIMKTE